MIRFSPSLFLSLSVIDREKEGQNFGWIRNDFGFAMNLTRYVS